MRPNPVRLMSYKEEKSPGEVRDIQREGSYEDGDRDWGSAVTRQGTLGATRNQSGQEGFSHRGFGGRLALLTP